MPDLLSRVSRISTGTKLWVVGLVLGFAFLWSLDSTPTPATVPAASLRQPTLPVAPTLPTPLSTPNSEAATPAMTTPPETQQTGATRQTGAFGLTRAQKKPDIKKSAPSGKPTIEESQFSLPTQTPLNSSTPANSTTQIGNTAVNRWDVSPAETKPVSQEAPIQPAIATDSKTVTFVGPKIIQQIMPNTKILKHSAITSPVRIEVEVVIDTSGHVKATHLLNYNENNAFSAAAIDAAKQWTFQPATLGGQNVESRHNIVFQFNQEGR